MDNWQLCQLHLYIYVCCGIYVSTPALITTYYTFMLTLPIVIHVYVQHMCLFHCQK